MNGRTFCSSGTYYQYANRLAHHFFLSRVNEVRCHLIFLYFLNDEGMRGPATEKGWHGPVREMQSALGLGDDLRNRGIFDAYLDVRRLC